MFKIGDLVTRKKYDNDILFKIIKIDKNKVILRGVDIRLYADSFVDDLVLSGIRQDDEYEEEIRIDKKKEDDYFYIPGLILHVDSDKDYLLKCEKYYKKNKVNFIFPAESCSRL
jgi:spore coat assembly protein